MECRKLARILTLFGVLLLMGAEGSWKIETSFLSS